MIKFLISYIFSNFIGTIKYYISFVKCLREIYKLDVYYFNGNIKVTFPKKLILDAFLLHHKVRQMYGNKVYFFHILDVLRVGLEYPCITFDKICVILFHDVVEDCGITFNDLSKYIGASNARSVILCTEYSRGLTRAERKPNSFYEELGTDENAIFAKGCDVFSNTSNAIRTGHGMAKKYKQEWDNKVQRYFANYQMSHSTIWIYDKLCKIL